MPARGLADQGERRLIRILTCPVHADRIDRLPGEIPRPWNGFPDGATGLYRKYPAATEPPQAPGTRSLSRVRVDGTVAEAAARISVV